jgi:hypothetical protein
MSKAELLADANSNHALLETARRIGDYDAAQQICVVLTGIYRLLELMNWQRKRGNKLNSETNE